MVQELTGKETSETPSLEEQLVALRSRLAATETELTQTAKGLKTAHQTLSEKDIELKRRAQVEEDIQTIRDHLELLTEAVSARQTTGDDETTLKTDGLAQLKRERQEREKKRQEQVFNETLQTFRVRTEALNLDSESEEYLDIQDLATRGNFKLADIRLKKMEVKKAEKDAEVAKTSNVSESEIAKRAEERAYQLLQERGLLKTDSGTPAGGGGGKTYTQSQVAAMSVAEYRKEFPTYADYLQAVTEGRVK